MRVTYDLAQIEAAAKFIADNNTFLNKTWTAIKDDILGSILNFLHSDHRMIALESCGYTILFENDEMMDDNHRFVRVLVDPSVGHKKYQERVKHITEADSEFE